MNLGYLIRGFACAACVQFATSASATWSILLADLQTGEIAVGSATCLSSFDLRAGTPVLIPGVGAATAQSFVDVTGQNRTLVRDLLAAGADADEIFAALDVLDNSHQTRQYGLVSTKGDAGTFSGTGAGGWAGGLVGMLPGAGPTGGDLVYAIQGNVLTGPTVVSEALKAIEAVGGDLPTMLMAGMEAARAQGGDGRCSCSAGAPTSCGEPPAMFDKSAHIAYMLVAREGDVEGCAPTYRLDQQADIAVVGLAVDGTQRLAVASVGSTDVSLHELIGDVAPARLLGASTVSMSVPIGTFLYEDLNDDGYPDLAAIDEMGISLWIRIAIPGTTGFENAVQIEAAQGLVDITAGDFDNDGVSDIAGVDASTGQVLVVFGDGQSGFTGWRGLDLSVAPLAVSAGDMDGDGREDLVVLTETSVVHVVSVDSHRDIVVVETRETDIVSPSRVAVFSPSLDGRPDVLVSGGQARAAHVIRRGDGTSAVTEYTLPRRPETIVTGDINGDGLEDALLTSGISSTILSGFSFVPDLLLSANIVTQGLPTCAFLNDLDDDGDLDLGYSATSWRSLRLVQNVGDQLGATTGCGSGEYFLNLNIAFADVADPDPVFTLRSQLDQWRAALAGRVDAVQSEAVLMKQVVSPDPACVSEVRIVLRDIEGQTVDGINPSDIELRHEAGSDAATSIEGLEPLGDGVYLAQLRGTGIDGHDRIRIAVTDPLLGVETVLMPALEFWVDDLADLDDDGDRDQADLNLWVELYIAGDPRADQNLDGVVDFRDFSAWLANAGARC